MEPLVRDILRRGSQFQEEAYRLFAKSDEPRIQVFEANKTRQRLGALSLRQQGLFEEALKCAEVGSSRAAVVMAWAAFIDYIEDRVFSRGLDEVIKLRPGWEKFSSVEEILEKVAEYQIIEVARDQGLITATESKSIKGLLAKRNECAHPNDHTPTVQEAIGFVSELLSRVEQLFSK